MKTSHVYIMANQRCTTLYVGVTINPERRILEHKQGVVPGFTKKYRVTKLVYIEDCTDIWEAIAREKRLKRWNHDWKIELIKQHNPKMTDLAPSLGDPRSSRG